MERCVIPICEGVCKIYKVDLSLDLISRISLLQGDHFPMTICRKAAICFYHPNSSDVPFNCPYQPIRQVGHNQNYYQVYKVTIALGAHWSTNIFMSASPNIRPYQGANTTINREGLCSIYTFINRGHCGEVLGDAVRLVRGNCAPNWGCKICYNLWSWLYKLVQ